jgi:hypothetical protein
MRDFIEAQFGSEMKWGGFGKRWKVGHVLASCYFDMSSEGDKRLYWNWMNLRTIEAARSRHILSVSEAMEIFSDRQSVFRESVCVKELIQRANDSDKHLENMKLRLKALRKKHDMSSWEKV